MSKPHFIIDTWATFFQVQAVYQISFVESIQEVTSVIKTCQHPVEISSSYVMSVCVDFYQNLFDSQCCCHTVRHTQSLVLEWFSPKNITMIHSLVLEGDVFLDL